MFVTDASVALAWYLRDEHAESVNPLHKRVAETGICVPDHWALEVTNALLAAARRNRLTMEELRALLPDLRLLVEETDDQTTAAAWTAILDLAKHHIWSLLSAGNSGWTASRCSKQSRRCGTPRTPIGTDTQWLHLYKRFMNIIQFTDFHGI